MADSEEKKTESEETVEKKEGDDSGGETSPLNSDTKEDQENTNEEKEEKTKQASVSSSGSIHMTVATVLGVLGVVVMVVYMVYTSTKYHQHHIDTWKTKDFTETPQHLVTPAQIEVELKDGEVTFDMEEAGEVSVFYRESNPPGGPSHPSPVLLLHGAGDSSERWLDLGTMHLCAGMGHRTVALDLPGWGNTKTKAVSDKVGFLEGVTKALGLERPIIVIASASGSYIIPYLMTPKPITCGERALGLITISPTGTGAYSPTDYNRCAIPVMLTYGVKDVNLGLESVGNLRNMPNSEIFPVEEAGHAMMFEQPDKWHNLVYNFLLALR